MAFNTGNPVGSRSPKDLLDNSENLDELVNSPAKESHPDRLGVDRKTWHGMEVEFAAAEADRAAEWAATLASAGYIGTGAGGAFEDYDTDGPLTIDAFNEIFTKDGEFYRAKPGTTLPYTTTGTWATDEADFVAVGDAALRSELAAPGGARKVRDAVSTVADITELRALTGLVDGQAVEMKTTGRAGLFVWTVGDFTAEAAADPQEGVYVKADSIAAGAGVWIRQFGQSSTVSGQMPYVMADWFGFVGDDATQNDDFGAGLISYLTAIGGTKVIFSAGTYLLDEFEVPEGVSIQGMGQDATRIKMTGDGTGAPVAGANGAFRIFTQRVTVRDIAISCANDNQSCLLNLSGPGSSVAGGNVKIDNVWLANDVTGVKSSTIGIYMQDLVNTNLTDVFVGASGEFLIDLQMRGFINATRLQGVRFRPGDDFENDWLEDSSPMVDIDCSTRVVEFNGCNFPRGPNAVRVQGQGEISFRDCYLADGGPDYMIWARNRSFSAKTAIIPSYEHTVTANSTADVTGVPNDWTFHDKQAVTVYYNDGSDNWIDTTVSSRSGTTLTLNDTIPYTGTVYLTKGDYDGLAHIAKSGGSFTTTQPTWPSSIDGTVTDNSVTFINYGPCAAISVARYSSGAAKEVTNINGCNFDGTPIGVCVWQYAGAPAYAVNVEGCTFDSMYAGVVTGSGTTTVKGNTFKNDLAVCTQVRQKSGQTVFVVDGNTYADSSVSELLLYPDGSSTTFGRASEALALPRYQNAVTLNTIFQNVNADGGSIQFGNSRWATLSDGTTGGTGSAGAGSQYVELEVNGTTYKVLHDGTT